MTRKAFTIGGNFRYSLTNCIIWHSLTAWDILAFSWYKLILSDVWPLTSVLKRGPVLKNYRGPLILYFEGPYTSVLQRGPKLLYYSEALYFRFTLRPFTSVLQWGPVIVYYSLTVRRPSTVCLNRRRRASPWPVRRGGARTAWSGGTAPSRGCRSGSQRPGRSTRARRSRPSPGPWSASRSTSTWPERDRNQQVRHTWKKIRCCWWSKTHVRKFKMSKFLGKVQNLYPPTLEFLTLAIVSVWTFPAGSYGWEL